MCLVPNPVLVPFLLIFDMYRLDIPPPLRGAPRTSGGSLLPIVNVKIRMYIFFNLRMYKNIKISVYELLFLRKIIL